MKPIEFVQEILKDPFFDQRELSIILNVNQSTISNWKRGKRNITSEKFGELCDVLGYLRTDWIDNVTKPRLQIAYKATSFAQEDLMVIALINKLALSLCLLEEIQSNETCNR